MKEFNVDDHRTLIVRMAEYKNSHNVTKPFDPPKTLGMPTDKRTKEYKNVMAMDRCIKNVLSGFNTDAAFMAAPAFVGYAMLSNVSQEALIRAGVETVADEMTRKFIQWTYDDDDGETDKEKELADLEEQAAKYKLKETFNDAALKDGYFGGCLVYIDLGELDDLEKEEPLVLDEKTFKKGSLKGLRVIEPINVYPGDYNTSDPTDEHYFNPEYWYVLGKKYHASRFLYFAGNPTPVLLKPAYNFFGIPQAQLALDYVAHFVANREAAQELLNKFSLTCWKTDMTQAIQGNSCSDLISRVKMFNRLKNNNGTMVLDKETEDMMQINTPLSGVRDIVDMSLSLLTAVWRIPKIKYLGEGEGGLNASSKEQMRSFYDYILSQKEKLFTQPLETVLKLFQLNMGKKINPAIGFKYPAMWDMDDSEKAALNKQQADRDAVYLANGVLSQEEVRRRLSLDRNSEYTMIDVDDVPEPQAEPLKDVNEEEENETVKKAMDMALDGVKRNWRGRMAMDDRWITIGHRDGNGEDDEGRKGRHILLKEGEEPLEALERTTKTDIDKDGKVGKKDDEKEGKKEEKPEAKPEPKPEEKKEEPKSEKKEEPKEEKKEPVSQKTPALEYAELLDKEKASGLSDSEKARKEELEKKEGFGESEVQKMDDAELGKKERELSSFKVKYDDDKRHFIEENKEYNELLNRQKAVSNEYYQIPAEYSQKRDEVNRKKKEIEEKINAKYDELTYKFDKEHFDDLKKNNEKLQEIRDEKQNRFENSKKEARERLKDLSDSEMSDRASELRQQRREIQNKIRQKLEENPEYKKLIRESQDLSIERNKFGWNLSLEESERKNEIERRKSELSEKIDNIVNENILEQEVETNKIEAELQAIGEEEKDRFAKKAEAERERLKKEREERAKKGREIAKKTYYPETIAGVSRGKPMTEDEADSGNPNPKYNSGDRGYGINCQSCVVCYEARLRGYDVSTMPNKRRSKLAELALKSNHAWIDPETGLPPESIRPDSSVKDSGKYYKFLEDTVKEGRRYNLSFAWKGRGNTGHIVTMHRNNSGALEIYDPQCGKKYSGQALVDYLGRISYRSTLKVRYEGGRPTGYDQISTVELLRVDNMSFNPEYMNDIMEKKQ